MKTIIAGSRSITNYDDVLGIVADSGFVITEVVSGRAKGVDRIGEQIANDYNILPIKEFPADWDRYSLAAGKLRNAQMAEYADALIAIWDGYSKGTRDMIDRAKRRGLKVYIGIV